ncbi:MAG: hypothetical protein GY931_10090 [Maribacter sp.]|nr:hypothetical protein [Maribacter sp.]
MIVIGLVINCDPSTADGTAYEQLDLPDPPDIARPGAGSESNKGMINFITARRLLQNN